MRETKPIRIEELNQFESTVSFVEESSWDEQLKSNHRKVIVLDDDPTGTQTVHGISVYTCWDEETIRHCFEEKENLVFILTNSRSLTSDQSFQLHTEIGNTIAKVSEEKGQEFILISRSDSTLRGHYPLETSSLRSAIESKLGFQYDGEIICPFFKEGGRYTLHNIHYAQEGDWLIPVGQTEFAKDAGFSFVNSHLGKWCEEKTKGEFKADEIFYIPNEWLSRGETVKIKALLEKVTDYNKVVVNAVSQIDIKCFAAVLISILDEGKRFMIRSGAAFPKVLGGISDHPLLTREELVDCKNPNGGLIIVGSHVTKTTEQVMALKESGIPLMSVEFNQHLIFDPMSMQEEISHTIRKTEKAIRKGTHVLIYTRREKVEPKVISPEANAELALEISDALSTVVHHLNVRPGFIVAKGGITSSDICTKGLCVTKARVLGQAALGVPVLKIGADSKFPGMPYVIFPGNVGNKMTLTEVVKRMTGL